MHMYDDRDNKSLSELRKDIAAGIAVLAIITFGASIAMQLIEVLSK